MNGTSAKTGSDAPPEKKVPEVLVVVAVIFSILILMFVGFCAYIAIAQPAWVINQLNNLSAPAN